MKVFLTTDDFYSSFKRFFKGHEVEVLPNKFTEVSGDLLVFTGGEDVNPRMYGGNFPSETYWNSWVNDARDAREMSVWRAFAEKRTSFGKVLGICRGLQFLNVCMGGSLIYDLQMVYGKPHKNVHKISWQRPNIFSSVEYVNSIHHQGIHSVGDNLRPIILGTEPEGGLIEAIMWGSDILAFQFHPETLQEGVEKNIFSKGIENWVEGKAEIFSSSSSTSRRLTLNPKSQAEQAFQTYLQTFADNLPQDIPTPIMPEVDTDEIEMESDEEIW